MSATILRFTAGPVDTNSYLVLDDRLGLALIVDAPWGVQVPITEEVRRRSAQVLYLVNTHGHWDHVADNAALEAATGARIAAHRLEAPSLEAPAETLYPVPFEIPSTQPDLLLEDGSLLAVGDLQFQVLHTPGHTPGSLSLYEPYQRLLFSGDTLFHDGYGRTNLRGSDEEEMWKSLARLSTLPEDVRVYPGHGPETTLGQEGWLKRIPAEL